VAIVPLDRRFVEWKNEESPNSEMWRAFGLGEVGIGWDELLQKRRVVILAEAGSGKSSEMSDRARTMAASKPHIFHAAVEDVGQDGLENAVGVNGSSRLTAWRDSTGEAWFFIDSVDEAKAKEIRLEKILRKLAEGINGAQERSHIILSGRITDWEFRKDLKFLKEWLEVPPTVSKIELTAEEELLRVTREGRPKTEKAPLPEQPFVVLMAPLDRERVRLFAHGKAAPNVDHFLSAVEGANLWHFARRPLDLDWLVRFWQHEGRLGSLAEMVERSIDERLVETNRYRARADVLENTVALKALERVGAAMVFGRQATLAIPDGEVAFSFDSPLDLGNILPDWSPEDCSALLARAVFDPATLGRVRLHNDNEGVVRGFLAARWLSRLRNANLSTTALFDLLFSESYGLEVIRPSMNDTVAWLSLWDKDVANEAVRRGPGLLLGAGDPATLTPEVRRKALVVLVTELATGEHEAPFFNDDALRRFAQQDLASTIISLWAVHWRNNAIADLLLRIVWLGAIRDCASLVADVTFDVSFNSRPRCFAARALLAIGDDAARRRYAELVITDHATLPKEMTRDALMELFPTLISVQNLLDILNAGDIANDLSGLGFKREGPRFVAKLSSATDLEHLLAGLLAELGTELGDHVHQRPSKTESVYFPAIVEAALRLLQASPRDFAPEIAIDAVLRICNRTDHDSDLQARSNLALEEIHCTKSRRRLAFWRVAVNLRSTSPRSHKVHHLREMTMLGYPPGLQVEDVEWLLTDGLSKGESDRRLAIDAALAVYEGAGRPAKLLEAIQSIAHGDEVAREVYRAQTAPRPADLAQSEWNSRHEEKTTQIEADRRLQHQKWRDFVRDLRSDPERIDALKTPSNSGVNADLFHLWRILDIASSQSSYALNSLAPLEKIVGREVSEAARTGFRSHWRNFEPRLRRHTNLDERNTTRFYDLMGLVGVSLEAADDRRWAERLSPLEATRAAGFATLEINRFPSWLASLAEVRPAEVRAVLVAEIVDEISRPELTSYQTLQAAKYADKRIAFLLARTLLDELEKRRLWPAEALPNLLNIIVREMQPEDMTRFTGLGIQRFEDAPNDSVAARYVAGVFAVDRELATAALERQVASLPTNEQREIVDRFLMISFGDSVLNYGLRTSVIRIQTLERLVRLSFQTYDKVSGRPSPDQTDEAGQARSAVFNKLVNAPGAATYQALSRLEQDPTCPVSATRLRALREERAVQDSESAPWPPSEVVEFEQHHETAPRIPKDLQAVVLRRLKDLQHDLLHGDFGQGRTLKALPKEVDVQNWLASQLSLQQGRSFVVEREPHVAGEKEPDIRIRAKAANATVSIEIKLTKSWTLNKLEEALEDQLCGRYLRARDGRHGILLLIHQKGRIWKNTTNGDRLSLKDVVARLSERAAAIAGMAHDAPQAEVAVIDVSTC